MPPAQGQESRYSLQPFLLFFPQIKVPLNDFPNMLGFFIGELGEVQLPAHLVAARREADPVTRSPRALAVPYPGMLLTKGEELSPTSAAAHITGQGQSCGQASRLLPAPQPLCRASLPAEPAAEQGWHGAYRLRGLLARREGGPAIPRGAARSRSGPRPPGWGCGRCLLCLLDAGCANEREPSNASPGKAGHGLWEGAEHPREEPRLHAREDRLHRGGSCPTRMLRSPARSSVSHLITQILSLAAVSEENFSASGFPPPHTPETSVLRCSHSNFWAAELCPWQTA